MTPFYLQYVEGVDGSSGKLVSLEQRIWKLTMVEPLESISNPSQLSEEQKFSLAVLGGARIESTSYQDGKMTFTTEPCGIVHDGNRFCVYVRSRDM